MGITNQSKSKINLSFSFRREKAPNINRTPRKTKPSSPSKMSNWFLDWKRGGIINLKPNKRNVSTTEDKLGGGIQDKTFGPLDLIISKRSGR